MTFTDFKIEDNEVGIVAFIKCDLGWVKQAQWDTIISDQEKELIKKTRAFMAIQFKHLQYFAPFYHGKAV